MAQFKLAAPVSESYGHGLLLHWDTIMLILFVTSLLSTITSPMRAVENNYNLNSNINSE